jgi:hypothetical protein
MGLPIGRHFYITDVQIVDEAADALEILANLNYLICADADDAAKVRLYATEAERSVRKLSSLIQSLAAHV